MKKACGGAYAEERGEERVGMGSSDVWIEFVQTC